MKKAKSLETKLRSAIRLIWSRSKERRAIIDAIKQNDPENGGYNFTCPLCNHDWPIQMAEVDHNPAIGSFDDWHTTTEFINKMFFGPQRVICKLCHKKVTASQRKRKP